MIHLENIVSTLKDKQRFWISFTGDSITSCEWVHPNWRDIVIYVLQDKLVTLMQDDWKVPSWGLRGFNFAYDGATTRDISDRLDLVLSVNPNLVIGLIGINDSVFGIEVDESIQNIKEVINRITQSGTSVIWCNSTIGGEGYGMNEVYKAYAEAFTQLPEIDGLTKIDMFSLYADFPLQKFYTFQSEEIPEEGIKEGDPDLIHPNQLGNAYIAKVVLKEGFAIKFDPEKYIADTLGGKKYPDY